jgi:hypothetical protein
MQVIRTPEYGTDLVSAQANHKYTLKNLNKNAVYVVELSAISRHENSVLSSGLARVKVDTSRVQTSDPVSSSLKDQGSASALSSLSSINGQDSDEEEPDTELDDEEEDDLDNDWNGAGTEQTSETKPRHQGIKGQPVQIQFTRNSPLVRAEEKEASSSSNSNNSPAPLIKNLNVQTPYFQNGLVKAKLTWQMVDPVTGLEIQPVCFFIFS